MDDDLPLAQDVEADGGVDGHGALDVLLGDDLQAGVQVAAVDLDALLVATPLQRLDHADLRVEAEVAEHGIVLVDGLLDVLDVAAEGDASEDDGEAEDGEVAVPALVPDGLGLLLLVLVTPPDGGEADAAAAEGEQQPEEVQEPVPESERVLRECVVHQISLCGVV